MHSGGHLVIFFLHKFKFALKALKGMSHFVLVSHVAGRAEVIVTTNCTLPANALDLIFVTTITRTSIMFYSFKEKEREEG